MFVCFLSLNFACTFIYDEQANNRLKNNESFNALSMMIHSRQKKKSMITSIVLFMKVKDRSISKIMRKKNEAIAEKH